MVDSIRGVLVGLAVLSSIGAIFCAFMAARYAKKAKEQLKIVEQARAKYEQVLKEWKDGLKR